MTGGRLKRLHKFLKNEENFFNLWGWFIKHQFRQVIKISYLS